MILSSTINDSLCSDSYKNLYRNKSEFLRHFSEVLVQLLDSFQQEWITIIIDWTT